MTAGTLAAGTRLTPARAVNSLVLQQVRRGALIVAVVCGGMSAIVAIQYRSMFGDALDQTALRALTENPAIRILFGTPVALDDAGGFTVWRTGTPLLILAGAWVILAATRITRGEEDAGRWDLLLAGRLRIVDLTRRCLVVLIGAAVSIGVAVAVALLAVRTDRVGATIHAAGISAATITFATTALLAAQVVSRRSVATGLGLGALGLSQLLRMLSDGVPQMAWTAWVTPLGLVAKSAPYADNRVVPLVVLSTFPVALAGATLFAASRRDLGGGLVTASTRRRPRTAMLRSPGGFAVRRATGATVAWALALGVYFLIIGSMLASVLQFLEANHRFGELAAAAGFDLGSAEGFAAALFSLLAIPTGVYAATRLSTMVADERARRWTPLFAAPISRIRLGAVEVAVIGTAVVVLHVVAGLAMVAGAAMVGAPLSIGESLAGALNSVPVAWLAAGAAAFAVGWLPSAVTLVGVLPVVGGFLLVVMTNGSPSLKWLADLSPFTHLAAVPDSPPDWFVTVVFMFIALALTGVGGFGYQRRDLST